MQTGTAPQMPITVEAVIARMEWAAAQQLSEFAFLAEGQRITIRRLTGEAPALTPLPAAMPAPDQAAGTVTAPLAGMCHLRPEAGGAPFVTPGTRVEAGQTICIIEAMKMMTAIPAPHAGTVDAVLVEDGATVAAGSPLMRIL